MVATLADAIRIKAFKRFIDENPSTIVLERGQRIKTTAGGMKWTKTGDVAPQVGRLIYSGNKGDNVQRTLPDGSVLVITHTLVFLPGADVERWDEFDLGAYHYVIGNVTRTPDWRVSCDVGRQRA